MLLVVFVFSFVRSVFVCLFIHFPIVRCFVARYRRFCASVKSAEPGFVFEPFTVLVFEPSLPLVRQTLRRWHDFLDDETWKRTSVRTVCSLANLRDEDGNKSNWNCEECGAQNGSNSPMKCLTAGCPGTALDGEPFRLRPWACAECGCTRNTARRCKQCRSEGPWLTPLKRDDKRQLFDFLQDTTEATAGTGESTSTPPLKVVFCTYHSASILREVQKFHAVVGGDVKDDVGNRRVRFHLAVFDEAHVTALHQSRRTRRAQKAADPFDFALDDKNVVISQRLFVTATPRIHRARGSSVDCRTVTDMSNRDLCVYFLPSCAGKSS